MATVEHHLPTGRLYPALFGSNLRLMVGRYVPAMKLISAPATNYPKIGAIGRNKQ